MPCYTVQQCTANLNNADLDLLKKALQKEGYTVHQSSGTKTLTFTKGSVSGAYRNNKLEFNYSGTKPDTDAIKRALAKEAILAKAAEYAEDGWELKQDGDDYWLEHPQGGYGATVNA